MNQGRGIVVSPTLRRRHAHALNNRLSIVTLRRARPTYRRKYRERNGDTVLPLRIQNTLLVCVAVDALALSHDINHIGLAERRERRRTKRAIVAPKVPIDAACDEENGSTGVAPKTTKATKGKRKKSTSLAAGLALMHGFTAKNIGRNRLTVR